MRLLLFSHGRTVLGVDGIKHKLNRWTSLCCVVLCCVVWNRTRKIRTQRTNIVEIIEAKVVSDGRL